MFFFPNGEFIFTHTNIFDTKDITTRTKCAPFTLSRNLQISRQHNLIIRKKKIEWPDEITTNGNGTFPNKTLIEKYLSGLENVPSISVQVCHL